MSAMVRFKASCYTDTRLGNDDEPCKWDKCVPEDEVAAWRLL